MAQQSTALTHSEDAFTFRKRGKDINRIEAFSDAVFAFSLTLLVVSVDVPNDFQALMDKLSNFGFFALCFALFITIWLQHFSFFRRYGLTDNLTILINALLLLVLLYFVYPLKFLFTPSHATLTFEQGRTLFLLYGSGFAAIYSLFALLFLNAYRLRKSLELTRVELFDTRSGVWANLLVAAVGVGSMVLAHFPQTISASGYFYFAIVPIRWGYGILARRRRDVLVAAERKRLAAANATPQATAGA